jgi:hypothetical protein
MPADIPAIRRWIIAAVGSALGGGITGAITAAMDPGKYRFPQDFGTGKLWPFFFTGASLVLAGMVLRSPWGQKVMGGYKETQAQLAASQKDLEQAKADLAAKPPKN